MTTIWRLTTKDKLQEAFNGEGARKHGGRWNSKGIPCVYASYSASLALLENLVHFELDTAPSLYLYSVECDDLLIESAQSLKKGWEDDLAYTQNLGLQWQQLKLKLVLEVPSVIVRHEKNYIINPEHNDFSSLKIKEHGQFDPDKRLFRS